MKKKEEAKESLLSHSSALVVAGAATKGQNSARPSLHRRSSSTVSAVLSMSLHAYMQIV
jgi:hypothetical protein